MIICLDVEQFILQAEANPLIDVRSSGEYNHAHIPKAYNLPLFDDEDRAIVGTAYKQQSREEAIKIGLEIFGPKMRKMVEEIETLTNTKQGTQDQNLLYIHCWRGGMRSGGVAWLMDLYGFKVFTLQGGYKAFRTWVLEQFERKDYNIKLLSGYTGCGKTEWLNKLEQEGNEVIDLEKLANHKGSAFGHIGLGNQPSQEMFENRLAVELFKKAKSKKPIWIEDESHRIGLVSIPKSFLNIMEEAPMTTIDMGFEERLERVFQEYGGLNKEELIAATKRIERKLGGLDTKTAIDNIAVGDIRQAFDILLRYYDRQYDKSQLRKIKV